MRIPLVTLIGTLMLAALVLPAWATAEDDAVERLRTDSRAPYVHRLTLYDTDGQAIDPKDDPQPFSTHATCGKCHQIGSIGHGWHFNAMLRDANGLPIVDAGRPGEPWILNDPQTGTQLPLSGRGWKGTWTPALVGMTDFDFVKAFGHHLPGGFGLTPDEDKNMADTAVPPGGADLRVHGPALLRGDPIRWEISGALEIDCLFCHSADNRHDPAEAERQIANENFKWIPTVAAGLAVVRGEARKVPDDYNPFSDPDPDHPEAAPPTLEYDLSRFDSDNRVQFEITRRPSPDRCYFCHSFRQGGQDAPERWRSDRDIHLTAGLLCTDCHRNGIDHMIARDYEGEPRSAGQQATTLSCRGCHLGEGELTSGPDGKGGRLGAPYPEHRGLPLIHFEKLTCTACHSGPRPADAAQRIQTAMNHGLGLPTRERGPTDPPTIVGPVFARGDDGKIEPQRLVWPAFWGVMEKDNVRPLPIADVQKADKKLALRANAEHAAELGLLTDEDITTMLTALKAKGGEGGAVAYFRGGNAYTLDDNGSLHVTANTAAAAYLWPMAHDVRPASQALGIHGCTDCHAQGAPIYAGKIDSADRVADAHRPTQTMQGFRGDNATLAGVWGLSFRFRSAFKVFGFICVGLIGIVLVRHGLAGIGGGKSA